MYIYIFNNHVFKKYKQKSYTTKMKTVDAKLTTYINSIKEINDEDPKFKIGDIGRISTYKNISAIC